VTLYRRTQFGTLTVLAVAAAIIMLAWVGARTDWRPVSIVVLVILGLALVLFYSLTIDIDGRRVLCYFGMGLIRRIVPVSEIAAAHPVRNRWYYGWGIRLTPTGWMFNVSGLDAVELELISGTRFRIGTDRPDEVARAVQEAILLATGKDAELP